MKSNLKPKKPYQITATIEDAVTTFVVAAYGISWIPNEVEKTLRTSHPDTYLFAEITKIEKL